MEGAWSLAQIVIMCRLPQPRQDGDGYLLIQTSGTLLILQTSSSDDPHRQTRRCKYVATDSIPNSSLASIPWYVRVHFKLNITLTGCFVHFLGTFGHNSSSTSGLLSSFNNETALQIDHICFKTLPNRKHHLNHWYLSVPLCFTLNILVYVTVDTQITTYNIDVRYSNVPDQFRA
jgi:hypothetical protein